MAAIVLPTAFPLVGLGIAAIAVLNTWQGVRVSEYRKTAGVKLPNLYATDAEAQADNKKMIFNCMQRSHANTLEMAPTILALSLFLGLFHPKLATALDFIWVFGRIFYTVQYSEGKPERRGKGLAPLHYIGFLGLFFSTAWTAGSKAYELYF